MKGSLIVIFFLHLNFLIQIFFILFRQAGKQIHGVIRSAYKIERQAAGMELLLKPSEIKKWCLCWLEVVSVVSGLKDILGELPRREASRFRSHVSFLILTQGVSALQISVAAMISDSYVSCFHKIQLGKISTHSWCCISNHFCSLFGVSSHSWDLIMKKVYCAKDIMYICCRDIKPSNK